MNRASSSPWPTDQVISAAQQGDPRAIATLVSGSHEHVQRFAHSLCATPEDAEDAAQEALIILYRRIGTLRVTAALASWLFQIVRNECIRRTRLALRRTSSSVTVEPSAEDAALARLEMERVVDSIAALPAEQRAVLVLRDIQGLSGAATAQALGLSRAAMKSRLRRGREAVRSGLQAARIRGAQEPPGMPEQLIALNAPASQRGTEKKMKRFRRGRATIVVLAALAVLSAASATAILAANHATTIRAGNLTIQAEGVISPKALPKNKMAPISLHASGSVATADGSHVPPAQTVEFQVDKHFRIESTGLPTCTVAKIAATSPAQAMKACGSALIAKGSAGAQVEFPEQAPFNAKGPLLGFNGPMVGGYPEMLYYIYVAVPAPTALVVVAKLSKDTGKYAYRISVAVPKVAGGAGSLTNVDFTVGRRWTYKGQKHSYLNAECPDGHFFNQIEAAFGDGTDLSGILPDTCQSKG